MVRLLRRLVLASLLVGGAAFVIREAARSGVGAASSHRCDRHVAAAESIRGSVRRRRTSRDRSSRSATPSDDAVAGSTPVDGQCPDGYPVKANDNSRIFHCPAAASTTAPCPSGAMPTPTAAVADGYRAAKA